LDPVIENDVFHQSHFRRAPPANLRAVPCIMKDAGH